MTKEELEKLEVEYEKLLENKEFWRERRKAIKRLSSEDLLPKYKGFWFWKRCPECNKKLLQKQTWSEFSHPGEIDYFTYYYCSCGWEYAQ
jgi:hypothetical protein